MTTVSGFYSRLRPSELSLSELFTAHEHFCAVPEPWSVVVTDIRKSTEWVQRGRHHVVNLAAAGSIIAALNIAHARGEEIPFFFGGDGATLLVPDELLDEILFALHAHSENTQRNFGMELRVGSVSLRDLMARGANIHIAKVPRTPAFSIPVVVGEGIVLAERIVKQRDNDDAPENTIAAPDLSGMECRWDRIGPPVRMDEVVCLLVNPVSHADSIAVTKSVIDLIDATYGPRARRNPISAARLKLDTTPGRLATETRARLGMLDWSYFIEHWLRTAIVGPAYFRFADAGRTYVRRIPELSDTLVIDGRINTVISGTARERELLTVRLEQLEARGLITFGLHVSNESIMSCYVRNRDDAHVHFVDGAGGGYTQAAIMLKRKLASGQ